MVCEEPELIDNGDITASTKECVGSWDIGCRITYTCADGYSLFGNQERICRELGEWSGHKPTCASKFYHTFLIPWYIFTQPLTELYIQISYSSLTCIYLHTTINWILCTTLTGIKLTHDGTEITNSTLRLENGAAEVEIMCGMEPSGFLPVDAQPTWFWNVRSGVIRSYDDGTLRFDRILGAEHNMTNYTCTIGDHIAFWDLLVEG